MSTQSLPSFAQAFSNHSLDAINTSNALPPIMPASNSRKRSQEDDSSVRVKQELDADDAAPPPSALMPAPKKRRVTVSGAAPQPLHIDVRLPADPQPASTPISPVVMGFTVHRDNPAAIEQVRNMITVKQKQKALIEQRRGSAAGLLSPLPNPPHTPVDDRPSLKTPSTGNSMNGASGSNPLPSGATPRTSRRSPNNGSAAHRGANPQRTSPPPNVPSSLQHQQQHHQQQIHQQHQQHQQQQQQQAQQQQGQTHSQALQQPQPPQPQAPPPPQHSLPPPPISFARRRAALLGGKRKPADIVISPREAHTREQLQPAIQSAPPVPHAGGQNQFYSGRLTMALPRLPAIAAGENPRRVAGNVPPTPTRLSMLQQQQGQGQLGPSAPHQHQQIHLHSQPHPHPQQQPHHSHAIGLNPPHGPSVLGASTSSGALPARSPPASIPIASTLVPPTPTSLHRPGYQGDKAAFLAPFEIFYDALADSRQLKAWLGDQLREGRQLMQALSTQQDRMHETIEGIVERRVGGVMKEVSALRRRVEELEAAAAASAGQGQRQTNGLSTEAYTFPPVAGPSASNSGSDVNASANAGPSSSASPSNGHARLRQVAERPELPRRRSSPSWGGEGGGGRERVAPSDHAESSRRTPMVTRQGSSGAARDGVRDREIPMVVVGLDREREREYVERDREGLREREREGLRERERESLRERDTKRERAAERDREQRDRERGRSSRRNSVVMAAPEEEEEEES